MYSTQHIASLDILQRYVLQRGTKYSATLRSYLQKLEGLFLVYLCLSSMYLKNKRGRREVLENQIFVTYLAEHIGGRGADANVLPVAEIEIVIVMSNSARNHYKDPNALQVYIYVSRCRRS